MSVNRVSLVYPSIKRPGFYGSYGVSLHAQSITSPTAGSPYAAFRWAPSTTTDLCAITRVTLSLATAVASTAGAPMVGLFFARGYTAADSNGTAVTLTGNSMKKRTGYPTTKVQDIRYGNNTAITAGTRTLDGDPIVAAETGQGNASTAVAVFDMKDDPLILANQEGLVLVNIQALTTAVWKCAATIEWTEFAAGAEL